MLLIKNLTSKNTFLKYGNTLLFILLPLVFFGQSVVIDTVVNRLDRAMKLRLSDGEKALKLIEETKAYALESGDKKAIWHSYDYLGIYYDKEHKFDLALNAFQEGLRISDEIDSVFYRASSLNHIGNVYFELNRSDKAKENIEEAIALFTEENNMDRVAGNILNLGNVYSQAGNNKKGLAYYLKAYEIYDSLGSEKYVNMTRINISYGYLMEGMGEQALPYIQKALAIDLKKKEIPQIAMGYGNLGYAYALMGRYADAFQSYQHCVDTAKKYSLVSTEYIAYKDISDTYKKSGNREKAMEYLEKYYALKDSVVGIETQKRIADLEVKYDTELKEKEITALQQQGRIKQLQIILLFVGLGLGALVAFLIIQRMRSKIQEKRDLIAKNDEIHRLERELMNNKFRQKELEQQETQKELDYKTKRLTDFALDITQKNQLSSELMKEIDAIEALKVPTSVAKKLRELRMMVNSNLQINEGLTTFQQNVDEIHANFNAKLKEQFPDLSRNDIILCGLLRLNLQNKEIATIRGVSDNAVKMARYRLRKKMNLDAEEDIVAFLGKL